MKTKEKDPTENVTYKKRYLLRKLEEQEAEKEINDSKFGLDNTFSGTDDRRYGKSFRTGESR
jgi:hypothetical protein